ncbi:hypothetical protein [Pseudodesulfovibrio pelocollis]|uniref:hypothetical protein n=1 Tax=Pseudodesulfovibrio pelocollis TaxID=3051432 RepID=UPI00255A7BD5|nr:hypothetical protein [Pseudodesulfovibrio sp. SB368]
MSEEQGQHIGDDQLVYGMPKRMVGIAGEASRNNEETKGYYWTFHPKPNACDRCKAMSAWKFPQLPQRPHPNCKCEIRKHPIGVNIMGLLKGYEAHDTHSFSAGQKITVEVRNIGAFAAGANIQADNDEWKQTGTIIPGRSATVVFTKFGEIPLPWRIHIVYKAGDNSTLLYFIRG